MIEFINVSYQYPKNGFKIHNLSLTIPSKGVTALWGENGSGKTTIAKLMSGVLRPDSGIILIDKKDSGILPLGVIGQTVGFLFQEPARQLFAVTVMEELTFAQNLKGVPQEEAFEQALKFLAIFDMAHLRERNVLTLSRGEKQRLAIAALLMSNPKIVILDEPTSGLDAESVEILSTVIELLVSQGKNVILITHDEELLERHNANIIKIAMGGAV